MKRAIRLDGNIAYVPLTRGYEAVIDADDVPLVSAWTWCASVSRHRDGSIRAVYALRSVHKVGAVHMHRVIAGTPEGFETDHIDGNGLNNRRGNLRHATKSQNVHNRRISRNNKSGVKGVSFEKDRAKWRAQISANGKSRFLGLYATVDEAAAAYETASRELHGQFGRTA